jgi:hypothetical protein
LFSMYSSFSIAVFSFWPFYHLNIYNFTISIINGSCLQTYVRRKAALSAANAECIHIISYLPVETGQSFFQRGAELYSCQPQ